MTEFEPSLTSTISEDNKSYIPNTVSHGRVDWLCSINSTDNVENYTPFLLYKIKVFSGSLWEQKLTEKQLKIYNEIKRLRKEGLTYKQISNNLNERGWTTSRGKKFIHSGVHSSEWKMERRIKILNRYKRTIEDLRVEFKYDVDKEDK